MIAEVKIDYVWNQDRLLLSPEKDFSTILPSDVDPSSVMVTTHLPEKVEAPVKRGCYWHRYAKLCKSGIDYH